MGTTKKAAVTAEGKVRLKALVPIEHDGESFDVGDELTVTEKQATQLLDVNAAEEVEAVEEVKT